MIGDVVVAVASHVLAYIREIEMGLVFKSMILQTRRMLMVRIRSWQIGICKRSLRYFWLVLSNDRMNVFEERLAWGLLKFTLICDVKHHGDLRVTRIEFHNKSCSSAAILNMMDTQLDYH